MARPKSKGAYVPLAAQYFMDDAILEAGPEAELLFVRAISFCASIPSEGFITEKQMRTIVGLGLRNIARRVDALLEVGLLQNEDGGYVVRSWAKWNKSAQEIGRLLAKDRARKAQKAAEERANSERNSTGIQTDSELQSSTEQSSTGKSSSSPRGDAAFAEFYMAYPRKVGKEGARRAFAKALKTASAEVIIAGARKFAADPNLPEKQFVPHPATWLNQGRWEDEPLPPREGGAPRLPDVEPGDEWMLR